MSKIERWSLFDMMGSEVRAHTEEDGKQYWVASDVAKFLGYRDAANMFRGVDAEDKSSTKVSTTQVNGEISVRRMTVVNESGLYTAVLRANSERVKPFQNWVFEEVLPSIFDTGGYTLPSKREEILNGPDEVIRQTYVEALKAAVEAEKQREQTALT